MNVEHLLALGFLGIGAIICLTVANMPHEGMYLLMIMSGYAFKNGVKNGLRTTSRNQTEEDN